MIREHEQFDILHYAFRYALGRATYVSGFMADALIHAWPAMTERQREMIVKEINGAINSWRAGHPMDVQEWQRVLDHAKAAG